MSTSKELSDKARADLAKEAGIIARRKRRRADINDELARPSEEGPAWEKRRTYLLAELERLDNAERLT